MALKTWSTWNSTDWRFASDNANATVRHDATLGDYIHFETSGSRCEARLKNGGTERWWPQGTRRVMTWTDRLIGMSQQRWLVTMQMKTTDDDVNARTPTRSMDGERSRWGGRLMLCARTDASDPGGEAEIMSLAELTANQGVWLDWLHEEVTGRDGSCYVRVAWKPHGASAWTRDIRVDGPNVRASGDGQPLTWTLGVYGGDSNLRQHDVLLGAAGPRLWTDPAEAEAAMGIGSTTPEPTPEPTPPETVPHEVQMVLPGPELSGLVSTWEALPDDAATIDHIDFYVDGVKVFDEFAAPYNPLPGLDTTAYPDGPHVLSVHAIYTNGEATASGEFTFNNAVVTPPQPDCSAVQAQLDQALADLATMTAQRDDALQVAMNLQGKIDAAKAALN